MLKMISSYVTYLTLDLNPTVDLYFLAESEDSRIITAFESFIDKLMEKESFQGVKGGQRPLLNKAYEDAKSRHNLYLTTSTNPKSQAHGDNIRSLRNFIIEYGAKLNKVFSKLNVPVPEVSL